MNKSKQNSPKPPQPDTNEQSGSAGRKTTDANQSQGANTGQGRYGQSGHADGQPRETEGEARYRDSAKDGDARTKKESNSGSGHASNDETKHPEKPDANAADIPKTG